MYSKKIILIFFLFISFFSFSQSGWEDPGFGGSSNDPATEPLQTPIDDIVLPLIITAIIFSFYFFNKRKMILNK